MNTLAAALKNFAESDEADDNISSMVKKASKRKPWRKKNKSTKFSRASNKKKTNKPKTLAGVYYTRLRKTYHRGLGSLRPCSLLAWKPGQPASVNGRLCRIKWGLSDGQNEAVVVLYYGPVQLVGTEYIIYHEMVPVSNLRPCGCQGHTHPTCN